ncbi:UNVERIFIED_CONTAM: hypothetical protein PYX00_010167 [Menopon gallinae]|uniref:Cytochrome P450 n=1 Tax=Menopon gallinae TaxID=328185 RepID=A0AAW2HEB5_9NEOP
MLARFTTDVISSCAFGIETKSLDNPDSEFRKYGKRIFENPIRTVLLNIVRNVYPPILTFLQIRVLSKDLTDFFINTVRDTIAYREHNNIMRSDFLQILIQLLKAGKVENVDKSSVVNLSDRELVEKFSLNEAAAQLFVFFLAGFETSSSALTYGLYEFALNPELQKRLQEEIDETMDKLDGQITYEALHEMEYLDMVVQEILRKYPSLGILQRKCTTEYPLPELGFTIEKGTKVFISAKGIQRDPNIYPNPEKFDPQRFAPEEKKKMDPMTYLPFGEGPRNCIGSRFGLMQMKVALVSIFKSYNVEVCEKTPIPLVLSVRGLFPGPIGGMPLIFTMRK